MLIITSHGLSPQYTQALLHELFKQKYGLVAVDLFDDSLLENLANVRASLLENDALILIGWSLVDGLTGYHDIADVPFMEDIISILIETSPSPSHLIMVIVREKEQGGEVGFFPEHVFVWAATESFLDEVASAHIESFQTIKST